MSRYSRSSDDGIEDRRFYKKRRLLHDVSSNNESLCQFKKANADWNEVLDKSDRRIFSGGMRKFSFGGSDISRSSSSLRQNNYSESHIATPGSSFFCNSDGDSECITNSFKTRPKFHKRDTVLLDDFKTALSRDVTLAQDPSFGTGLESNKSCFIVDNSGNFATDDSLDNTCDHRGMRLKYRRHKSKQHSPKERKDFENILNDVTTSEYQSRIVPTSTGDNENEITNVDLNEVSHFKSNETGYGAPSAITYSTQIVTQTGQFGGMSYVTISEVKERVIIPGRSCPRPIKKGRREGTASEVNYNDNIDNGYGNASIKSTNSVAEMSIHEEGVAGNQSEILSDFEVESDVLNRSGPRQQYYSPLKHSRQVKQRKTKRVISKDVYAEFYEDDSIFNSDINIASPLSIVEMDDSNTYNSTLRSQKGMQNRRNSRHSRTKNESYGSSFNDISGRSNRRSILREISQNEFELRLVEDDIQCNDHEVSRYRNVSENSEKLFHSAMDAVKNVHDNVIEERIKKDMSTEVRKMTKKCKENFMESNADSDENIMHEPDSVPMIIERRQKRRNKSKMSVENEFDTANRDCSMSDSIISMPCVAERTSFTQKERIIAAEKRTSKSHEISRRSRSIADLEDDVQNSMILSLNGSKNMSIEVCGNDENLGKEDNLPMNMEKPKRRNKRRKRNGSKEFNLTIENASLSSTAESSSSQHLPSFVHEKKEVPSNSTNNDNITQIEDVTPEQAVKDKPCSGKMKGNYSKSMLIIDPGLEKEDYSLYLDQPRPRRRRNQVKPTETDQFIVHLEDVSSNVEESISSFVDASHQLKMDHKSSVSADEIPNADTGHQKISKQGARESTLTMKKESSGKAKRSFDHSSSISDDFRVEANSPVLDIARPKRRNKQLLSGKGDTFNVHLEEVSSKAEESISLVAEAYHQSQTACKSSISVSSEFPDVANKQKNSSKQKTEDDSSASDQQKKGEIKMNIDKSRLITDATSRRATNYPAINIAKQKRGSNEMQPLKGDEINVPQNAVSSSKIDESISTESEAIHQLGGTQESAVPQNAVSSSKNVESNSSEAKAIHQLEVTQESAVPQNAVSSSKNAELISTEPEDNHQSRVAEESAVPADILPESSLASGNSTKKNIEAATLVSTYKTSIVDDKLDNTSKRETADYTPPIDEQVNDETKRNISKSRVADDDKLSMGVNSPPLNVKNCRRKNQRKSVNGNEFNIAMEGLSVSNAADSITSIAEISHSEKSAEDKAPEGTDELEDPSKHKTGNYAPAIGEEVSAETKGNISQSRLISDEELSMDSAVMIVGRRKRRKNKEKSVPSEAFNIAVGGVSTSSASDSILSEAEASIHSYFTPQACLSEEDIPKGSVEPKHPFGKSDECVASVIDEQLNVEAKTNISRSTLILDADNTKEVKSPEKTIKMQKTTNIPVQKLQSDEIDVLVDDVILSKKGNPNSSEINSIHELKFAQKCSVPANIVPESIRSSEDLVNKSSVDETSVSNGVSPKISVESGITSKQEIADDAPTIDQLVKDETIRNMTKSRVADDEKLSMCDNCPPLNDKNHKRKYQRKSVNGNEFNIAMEGFSVSNAADSIAENSHSEKSAKVKEPESIVESEDLTRHTAVDVAPAIDQEANDETKRNMTKSRVEVEEDLSLDVNSPPLNVKTQRRKKQRKSVNGNEFNITMEGLSVSNAADSISSIAEISHSEKSSKVKESENIVESEDLTRHTAVDIAPAIDQEANDEPKRNISKSRVAVEENLSLDVNSPPLNLKTRRRKKQRKSVNGIEFNMAMEGLSVSNAADSITSIAEISHSEKSSKVKESENIVESEDLTRHTATDVVPAIDQEANDEPKRNISKSRVAVEENLSLDVNSPPLNVKNRRRKNQRKSVNGNEFNIAMEGLSVSNAADSITSIAEISHSEKSAEDKAPEGTDELEDPSKHKTGNYAPAIGEEVSAETKGNISQSRLISDEELSMDSAVMIVGRRKRRKNKGKSVQSEAFNIAVGGVSTSSASDSILSEVEASCQSEMAQNSPDCSHPLLDGCFPDLMKTNFTVQTLVDGKVAEDTPVKSDLVNENSPDCPQIECSLDNSLSVSKISNVLGNDVAESTRGFINNKWLISEYFGDVSRITDDVLTGGEGLIVNVVSARNNSKKSLDLITNKVETSELPHEALRCKSGGENFSLEGFHNFSLEKQNLDSPERVKSNENSISPRSNSKVVKCDVDLIMDDADIAAEEVPEKGELIEVPTEIPSKSELSISLKSSIHNLVEKRVASCIADAGNLNKDVSDSRVSVENVEGEHSHESIDRYHGKSGVKRCLDSKQNENPPAKEATDQEGVGKPRQNPEHSDMEKSNVCPSVAVKLISEQVAPHASFHKSSQVKTAAETVEKGLMEKYMESSCNLVIDQAAVVKEALSNENPGKIVVDGIIVTSAVDASIQNVTNLISKPVSMAPEKILTVQPSPKESTSCTSSTPDKPEKLHQTLVHNQSSSKSKNMLTDEVLLIQNSHLDIKSSVEQKGKTNTGPHGTGSSKEETITTSCQPNSTLAPKILSKLPIPIKHNKGSYTSKSTPLLKNPSTSHPKLVLSVSPEKEELQRKLSELKSINEETFTILPQKKSSEEADNLFEEILENPSESSHLKSIAPDLHDSVHKVSGTLGCENLNAAGQTEVLVLRNTESGKLNLSLSFTCLETQGKTSTTINELTFIKTAAPGMTSTPLPSMHCFENMRNTEDVSMLSGISESTLDQIAAQEQKLDPVTKGNLSVIESSPAVNELTFIKSNSQLPCIGEEASQVLSDEKQNKETADNKISVSVIEPAESSVEKAREIINNSTGANHLRSSLINIVPGSIEPEVEEEEEKGTHSAKELTFTISAALATLSPSKCIVLDKNERSKFACASEPVNSIMKSGNSVLPSINDEYSEEMVNGISSELFEVNSVGNVMGVTKPDVHLNVAKGDAQSSVTVANSNISSINKMLQNATNLCNPSKNDVVNNDAQKPVPHSIDCATPSDPTYTTSKPTSPKTNETSNKLAEKSEIFNELLLLSPLSTSRWNAICHTSDCVTSMISSEVGDSEKITSTGNESERCSDPKYAEKSPSKECEVNNSRSSGTAREQTINSSGLPYLREADVSHLRVSAARSFELNDPRPSYSSESDKEFRNIEIGGQNINVSDPHCSRNAEGSHLRLSAAVGSKFIHPRPSSSMLSERSSLRPSISNPAGWSSLTLSSAKESDGDLTRPGLSSHTSEESSVPISIESLSTPLRTRYRYFSTPNTAERKAVYEVIDRIDASAVQRKKQRDLIFDTIFPKVVPASKEFKKPRIPPKPKKAQVEDFDEDEDKEVNPPEKKRRLPVWARNELKTVVTEAIEEQEDRLLDPQDFLFDLVDTIKLVMKSKRLKEVRQGVQKVKQELFNLKLIRTLRDFYQFVRDYLPYEFRRRSIPSSGHYKFNPVWEIEADLDCSLFGSVEGIQNVFHL